MDISIFREMARIWIRNIREHAQDLDCNNHIQPEIQIIGGQQYRL